MGRKINVDFEGKIQLFKTLLNGQEYLMWILSISSIAYRKGKIFHTHYHFGGLFNMANTLAWKSFEVKKCSFVEKSLNTFFVYICFRILPPLQLSPTPQLIQHKLLQ